MAEPKMCATPGCGNPAAYRARSKPAYCADCIGRIASEAGLALEEPVVKPNDFIMTTCKRCGGRAHCRFNYILDKHAIGEPVCRRCYWESWYRGSWEQFGFGQGHRGAMSKAFREMKSLLQSYKMMSRRQAADGDAPRERRVMNIDNLDLSPELREKAKACKTPEEMLALAKKEGYKLSDAEMETVSGGRWDDSLDLGPM